MALNFAQKLAGQTETQAPAGEKKTAKLWLNVGMTIPMPQKDGTVVDTFVSLPLGIPLDTIDAMEARGNSTEWHHMVQAKNWLLSELQNVAGALEPGKHETIEGLEIQLRRVADAQSNGVPSAENPLLAAMQGRLSVVK